MIPKNEICSVNPCKIRLVDPPIKKIMDEENWVAKKKALKTLRGDEDAQV